MKTVRFDGKKFELTRRKLLSSASAAAVFAPAFAGMEGALGAVAREEGAVNRNSSPSELRITDVRAATVGAACDYPIVRVDTNQGVYGLGEVVAGGSAGSALILKAHLVGRNPLEIGEVLDSIRLSAGQEFWNTGYGAVDLALHDIAGKVYGAPVWRLLGEKRRDKVLLYCDCGVDRDAEKSRERVRRRQAEGFRFLKVSLSTGLVRGIPGAVNDRGTATEKGLGYLGELVAAVRDELQPGTPLCAGQFGGGLEVSDAIRYAKALEKYDLAWAEDWIGKCWINWRGFKTIRDRTNIPVVTGGQGFGLEECFYELIHNYAVDIVHPDYVASGGIREIKRIADFAAGHGIPTAIHMPGSPIGQAAMAHVAAVLPNLVAVEHDGARVPWWREMVTGLEKPWMEGGCQRVPDGPGLGVELNEEVVRERLRYPGYFEATPGFDGYVTSGRRRGGAGVRGRPDGEWAD